MKKSFELLLAIVAALPSIYAVLFTPALPSLAKHFNVTFGQVQQTMIFYLAGYALGQLPYGPLSNKFGRKPVFYIGMIVAILSSLIVILSGLFHSFLLFIIARFFMACGACVGLNVAYTIIGDLYEEQKALKILSFILLLSAVIPGIATAVGGFLTEYFGWSGCFYFLALFGFFITILVRRFLPETNIKIDHVTIHPHQIFRVYWHELHNKWLVLSALATGCGASMIYLFASTAPFIGINHLGLSPEEYGSFAIVPSIGLLSGSILTKSLTRTLSLSSLMIYGSFSLMLISVCYFLLFLFLEVSIFTIFIPMLFIDISLAMIFSTTAALALTRAHNKAIGSSLMSFINLSLTAFSVIVLILIPIRSLLIIPLLFVFLSLIVLLISFKITSEKLI